MLNLGQVAANAIGALADAIAASPPEGVSQQQIADFFHRRSPELIRSLASLLDEAPLPRVMGSWRLSELESIEGKGGLSYQVTHIKLGDAEGFVREGLEGDRFMLTSNQRLAMGRGLSIPKSMQQVLYLAADPLVWDKLADAVARQENIDAAAAAKAPRPVLSNARWTMERAADAVRVHLSRQAGDAARFSEIAAVSNPAALTDPLALGLYRELPKLIPALAKESDATSVALARSVVTAYRQGAPAHWVGDEPRERAVLNLLARTLGAHQGGVRAVFAFIKQNAKALEPVRQEYRLVVDGWLGRPRTSQRKQTILLSTDGNTELPIDRLRHLIRAQVAEWKYEPGAVATVKRYPILLAVDGTEQHAPGTESEVLQEVVGAKLPKLPAEVLARFRSSISDYDYGINDEGEVTRADGRSLANPVDLTIKRGRLHILARNGKLLWTGGLESLPQFLERYWYASKKKPA